MPEAEAFFLGLTVFFFIVICLLWFAIIRSVRHPHSKLAPVTAIAIILLLIFATFTADTTEQRLVVPVLVCACVIDIGAVSVLRGLIRGLGEPGGGMSQNYFIVGVTLTVLVVAGVPYALLELSRQGALPGMAGIFGKGLLGLLLSTLIPPGLLMALLLSLGLHRVLWPFVLRPLYTVRRHKLLFAHRKAALAVAAALVLAAWQPNWLGPLGRMALEKTIGVELPTDRE
jgi:hypothetical protein